MAIIDFTNSLLSPANGFNAQTSTITGLVGTNLGYTIKNYDISKKNLQINTQTLDINKEILDINRHILEVTDAHLSEQIMEKVFESINNLCDLQRKNNELLEKLISIQGGENK